VNRFAFLTPAADRARLPVALISGFLGSGKTALVNALLRDPRMAPPSRSTSLKGTAIPTPPQPLATPTPQ